VRLIADTDTRQEKQTENVAAAGLCDGAAPTGILHEGQREKKKKKQDKTKQTDSSFGLAGTQISSKKKKPLHCSMATTHPVISATTKRNNTARAACRVRDNYGKDTDCTAYLLARGGSGPMPCLGINARQKVADTVLTRACETRLSRARGTERQNSAETNLVFSDLRNYGFPGVSDHRHSNHSRGCLRR
jgi:hypothetical protein